MKKFVIFLLIFVLLLTAGGAYNASGEFLGVRSMLMGGLDFVMFIPDKVKGVLDAFNVLDFNIPQVSDPTIPCDIALPYEVGDEIHIVYLDVMSFTDRLDTIFGYMVAIMGGYAAMKDKWDKWEFRIVANTYESKWVGETLVLYADPYSLSDGKGKLYPSQEFPDGKYYNVDNSVELPYDKYSEGTHGGR